MLVNCFQQRSYVVIMLMIMLKLSFFYFKHYFLFLTLMNFWQFYLSNWQGLRPVWTISVCFVDKGLLVWVFPQLHKLKFSCYLKSSKILAFCFLFVWLIKLKMYPSSISQLGFFQGIICNIERLKGVSLKPWITGGPKLMRGRGGGVGGADLKGGTSDLSSYHDYT